MSQPEPRREPPDKQGWWARWRAGRISWFFVRTFDDAPPGVWCADIEDYVDVTKFHAPLTRWFGPVEMPELFNDD